MYSVMETKSSWWAACEAPKTKTPLIWTAVAVAIVVIGSLTIYFTSADVRTFAGSVVTQLNTAQLTVGQTILIGLPLMAVGALTSFIIRLILKTQERKELDFYDITDAGRKKEIKKTLNKLFDRVRDSRKAIYVISLAIVITLGIILASNGPLLSQPITLGKALASAAGFAAGFYLLLHAILFLEKRIDKNDKIKALSEAQKRHRDEDT